MITLPDISVELIEAILQYLEVKDHQSVRLVCSRLYQKGFRHSCNVLFTEIAVEISRKSLEVLREISLQEEIAPFVKTLRIKVGHESDPSLGGGFDWTRQSGGCLEDTNEAIQIFREAIHQLQNLQNVEIVSFEGPEIAAETSQGHRITHPDCLYMILRAFADEKKTISSLHIPFVPDEPPIDKGPLIHRAFAFDGNRIPPQAFKQSEQHDFRRNIKHLTLHLDSSCVGIHDFVQGFLYSIEALESRIAGIRIRRYCGKNYFGPAIPQSSAPIITHFSPAQ